MVRRENAREARKGQPPWQAVNLHLAVVGMRSKVGNLERRLLPYGPGKG